MRAVVRSTAIRPRSFFCCWTAALLLAFPARSSGSDFPESRPSWCQEGTRLTSSFVTEALDVSTSWPGHGITEAPVMASVADLNSKNQLGLTLKTSGICSVQRQFNSYLVQKSPQFRFSDTSAEAYKLSTSSAFF